MNNYLRLYRRIIRKLIEDSFSILEDKKIGLEEAKIEKSAVSSKYPMKIKISFDMRKYTKKQLIGLFSHELSHLEKWEESPFYYYCVFIDFIPVKKDEDMTDIMAIDKGYAKQLYAHRKRRLSENSDNVKKNKKDYFDEHEIRAIAIKRGKWNKMEADLIKLTEKQKKSFVKEYLKLIKKLEKEFKLSLMEKFVIIFSKILKPYILNKNAEDKFKKSIVTRKRLLKFANNKQEKEILKTWIKLDEIVIKDYPDLYKSVKLEKEYKDLTNKFKKEKNFERGKKLLDYQMSAIPLYKKRHSVVKEKVYFQEKLKKLTQEYDKYKNRNVELILIGILTDIISQNPRLVGTKTAFSYTLIKKYRAQIRNTILLTKYLKKKVKKKDRELKILEENLNILIKHTWK